MEYLLLGLLLITPLTSFFGVRAANVVCNDFTVDSPTRVSVDSLESEARDTATTMESRPLLTPRFRTKFDRLPEHLESLPEEDERIFSVSLENHEARSSRWRRSDHSVEEEELLLRSFESMSSRELRYLLEALSVSRESDSFEMERKLEFARRLARREATNYKSCFRCGIRGCTSQYGFGGALPPRRGRLRYLRFDLIHLRWHSLSL